MPEMYDYQMEGTGTTAGRRPLKRPAIYDVYDKFDAIRLTRMTEFEKMKGSLVFWAHDDTVEPGKTYQYRIRLGVFNPVAGTDRLSERDKARKTDVILWSNYSGVTKPVEIMDRMYFFANRVRETDKAVTVQVSRLALGRWYSHDFIVQHGELIGEPLEPEPEKPDRNAPGGALGGPMGGYPRDPMAAQMGRVTPGPFGGPQDRANVPEMINYATGAVMVDAVVVNDWLSEPTLRTRNYYDMLYSFNGINIEHMPVGSTYWDLKRQTAFTHIARVQREPQKPFRSFGTTGRRQRPGGDQMMDEYYNEYQGEEMYMEGGGMGDGRPLY